MNLTPDGTAVSAALQARIDSLLAERYASVPRASHVAAVNAGHPALVVHYATTVAAEARQDRQLEPMTGDTAVAREMLNCVLRCHAGTAA